jgi:cytochrome c biogenesis protein CcdA
MNTLMKSLGVVILFIGVGILAYTAFASIRSNTILAAGLITIIVGFFAHIFLNKKYE